MQKKEGEDKEMKRKTVSMWLARNIHSTKHNISNQLRYKMDLNNDDDYDYDDYEN